MCAFSVSIRAGVFGIYFQRKSYDYVERLFLSVHP